MRTTLRLLATTCLLLSISSAFCQSLNDYILQQRGDTLVIKDYADMGGKPNSLYYALKLDTANVPPGRVYGLKPGGLYPADWNPRSSAKHPTVIVGLDTAMVAKNANPLWPPPLICVTMRATAQSAGVFDLIADGNLTVKNCALVPATTDGFLAGWNSVGGGAPNIRLLIDNCILERNRWVFVMLWDKNCNITFRNCYFVNMTGQPCRRNGGVFDTFAEQDTLLVENCTHVMAQGSLYRFRSLLAPYRARRFIVNHNTFINCAGYAFMNPGFQDNISLTNNLFINSNIQPYPGIASIDQGEQDLGFQPMGLVNLFPDSADLAPGAAPRKFLVEANLAFWDPYLSGMPDSLNARALNGVRTWQSQMIVANARTDSMFRHLGPYQAAAYSHLVMGSWKHTLPSFTAPQNLFSTTPGGALYELKKFALATVDTSEAYREAMLPAWRLVNTRPDQYLYPDWPIPVDLSYSNPDLKTGGIGGFPLGDLNWFPAEKAAWTTQRARELEKIQEAMDQGRLTGVSGAALREPLPERFALQQNYPNPFNPTTTIRYALPYRTRVRLNMYSLLGEQVATLLDREVDGGVHEVQFDGTSLASGVYFYRLEAGIYVATRKLLLVH